MKRANLNVNPRPLKVCEKINYSSNHPLHLFSEWIGECMPEHQIELAEFIGHFCYPKLFATCNSLGEKIFALREYLKVSEGIIDQEEKLLLFIDEIIEFIKEINEIAYEDDSAFRKVMSELHNVTSLKLLQKELPDRMETWIITYEKWQDFKMKFSFFNDRLEDHQILAFLKNTN